MTKYNLKKGGRLLQMGFWKYEDSEIPPLIGQKFSREAVVAYMASAREKNYYKGLAVCRICDARLGACDMVTPDGIWIFPQRWEHYIIIHGMAPTEPQFIECAEKWHIKARAGWLLEWRAPRVLPPLPKGV